MVAEHISNNEQLLRRLYDLFNARDIDGVLSNLDNNVAWANGRGSTHVHGREAVREYWTNKWLVINPRDDPVNISTMADGSIVVEVHKIVHDLKGTLLLDETVGHMFHVAGGQVKRFDILPGSHIHYFVLS